MSDNPVALSIFWIIDLSNRMKEMGQMTIHLTKTTSITSR